MKSEEIIDLLEEKSGLSMSKGEFGFITGTVHPFGISQGMTTAVLKNGYIMWRKIKDDSGGEDYREFYTQTPVMNQFDITVAFLTLETKKFHEFLETKGFMTITAE
jgi:hypothetical protein